MRGNFRTRRQFLRTVTLATLPAAPARAAQAVANSAPALFELRSYACQPGRRDILIRMFEQTFLDAYQSNGTRIIASFRHLDDPDRWVWIRGFHGTTQRGTALTAFYDSTASRKLAAQANATIREIHPALLLREPGVGLSAFATLGAAPAATAGMPTSRVVIDIYPLADKDIPAFAARFERDAAPALAVLGGRPFATLITDHRENSFPGQAVRGDTVFVALTRFADARALAEFTAARAASTAWRERVAPALAARLTAPVETYPLQPTARSALH